MINRTRQTGIIANPEQLTRINDNEKAVGLPDAAAIIDDNLEAGYWRAFSPRRCFIIQNSYNLSLRKDVLAELIVNDTYDSEGNYLWIHAISSKRKGLLAYMLRTLLHFAHWNSFDEIVMDEQTASSIRTTCNALHIPLRSIGNGIWMIHVARPADE